MREKTIVGLYNLLTFSTVVSLGINQKINSNNPTNPPNLDRNEVRGKRSVQSKTQSLTVSLSQFSKI